MIRTHGLSHLSLALSDPDRALAFDRDVFGVAEYFRDEKQVQARGLGSHDILAFFPAVRWRRRRR